MSENFWTKVGTVIKSNLGKNVAKIVVLIGTYLSSVLTLLIAFLKSVPFDTHTFWIAFLVVTGFTFDILLAYVFGNGNTTLKEQNLKNSMTIEWLRDEAEYRAVIAARDGQVPEALSASHAWGISNEQVKENKIIEMLHAEIDILNKRLELSKVENVEKPDGI